jgi:ABC-type multidrug transport system ATPase subunit
MSLIEVNRVRKTYGDIIALDDFSLTVMEKEIVALLGPDGAGKTSLMRILCNLIDWDAAPDTSVTVAGRDIATEFGAVTELIGYMPQTFSLYPDLSVEENMTFYAGIFGLTGDTYRQQRDRMYKFSNLGPFAGRRAGALSGGMKQKLALSCALLHRPKILLLDEPTTGVDPLSRRQFWLMLEDLRQEGVTVLAATPYMDEVARADRVICMFEGRRLAEASPDQLVDDFEGQLFQTVKDATPRQIARLNEIDGLQARRFGAGLRLSASPGLRHDELMSRAASAGVELAGLEPIAPDIEDRFVQLLERQQ